MRRGYRRQFNDGFVEGSNLMQFDPGNAHVFHHSTTSVRWETDPRAAHLSPSGNSESCRGTPLSGALGLSGFGAPLPTRGVAGTLGTARSHTPVLVCLAVPCLRAWIE